jgi:hypothetical protein
MSAGGGIVNEQIMSSVAENWQRRWEEAMRRRASQVPAGPQA